MKTIYATKIIVCILSIVGYISASNAQKLNLTTVDAEGKATIQAIVPNAKTVRLKGLPGTWGLSGITIPFTKMDNDLWQATTSAIAPGFHYYRLEVNGFLTSNPNEYVYYGGNAWTSGLEIPGNGIDYYDIKDVPHGTIRMQIYYSTITQSHRRCFIYLPPFYDTKSNIKYPVLFLQHGNSESEFSWHMQGKVNFILDNLISEGKAVPMIVVMDNGMTFENNTIGYANLVINDLIPLLEVKYKVETDKHYRAVAGLSMGGSQALVAGLFFTDIFSYVGDFSGGFTGYNWAPYVQNINDSIELLWLGWGTSDEYVSTWTQFASNLSAANINYVKVIMTGGHQWQIWRDCLYQFAQLVFKPFTYPPIAIQSKPNDKIGLVYPNPFSGYLHISIDSNKESISQYKLIEISGKKMIEFEGNTEYAEEKISMILRNAKSNMYILSVTNNQNVYNFKIIKK
jgi:enterochelin esterase-like enzyme